MNKYDYMFKRNELLCRSLNKYELNILLFRIKKALKAMIGKDKFDKSLNNSFFIAWMLNEYCELKDEEQKYCKHILDKLNTNYLYGAYLRLISNDLFNKEWDYVNKFLDSFVSLGLILDAKIVKSNDPNYIELITIDNKKMRFSSVPCAGELIDNCRGYCHAATSTMIKCVDDVENFKVAVVLLDNALLGKGYHSFIVKNGVITDFAHNIMMKYNDYLELLKPEVLVYENVKDVLLEFKKIEQEQDFIDSKCADVLKYGISKQLKK